MWKKDAKLILLAGIIYLVTGLFKLNEIPGDWYGDIDIVHEQVLRVQSGTWPFVFELSAGPVYHYLITPLVYLWGQNYLGYKLASVIVGLGGVMAIYFLGKEVANREVGVISSILAGTSFWYLVWARTGNSQILIPVVISLSLLFLARFIRKPNEKDALWGAVVSSLGLFIYPQTFMLPGLFGLGMTIKAIQVKKLKQLLFPVGILILAHLVFLWVVGNQKDLFTKGYIGSKAIKLEQIKSTEFWSELQDNLVKTLGMFHIKGDDVFRVNVPGSPQLDKVSGILLLIGLGGGIIRKQFRKKWIFLTGFLFVSLLPSLSPAIPDVEIPNSGRTIGIIPIVFFFISMGIWLIYESLANKYKWQANGFIFILITVIAGLNLHKYFILYPQYLPNGNVSVGRETAKFLDKFPVETKINFVDCCWGDFGSGDPKSIYYQMKKKTGRKNIMGPFVDECKDLDAGPNLVVVNPNKDFETEVFLKCFEHPKIYSENRKGVNLYEVIYGEI